MKGFSRACKANGLALIGGETAEMPGVYSDNDYDIAGTIVGVVDKSKVIDGKKTRKGDVLIGLPSTGLHTNGYSLARKTLLSRYGVDSYVGELGTTAGEALLKTHRSYLKIMQAVAGNFTVRGMVHVTGGGIEGNTVRVIRKPRKFRVFWENWEVPPIFRMIQEIGKVPANDARRALNMGIGLIIIIPAGEVDAAMSFFRKMKEKAVIVGEVVA